MPLHHLQFTVFLHTHRSNIVALLEEAYNQTGGYYGTLSPWQQRSQANIDSVEFIADLLRGDFVGFVREYTRNDAPFGDALIRRSNHVAACFRAKALFMDLHRRRKRSTTLTNDSSLIVIPVDGN